MRVAPDLLRTDEADDGVELSLDRVDRRSTLRRHRKTPEGFLICEGFAVVPGIQRYRNSDGSIRRELVLPETIAGINSLQGKPITLNHPKGKKVTSKNARGVVVGSVTEARVDDSTGMLQTELTIYQESAIKAVEKGRHGLSPGYKLASLDMTPGVHAEYGAFDCTQGPRLYNHLTICDPSRARGGEAARIRTDCIEIDDTRNDDDFSEDLMDPKLLLALITALGVRVDANTDDEQLASKAAEATANAATLQARVDTFEAAVQTPEEVEKARLDYFNERAQLVTLAKHFRIDAIDDVLSADLRKKITIKAVPNARTDADDAYYIAMCDIQATNLSDRADADEKKGKVWDQFGKDTKAGSSNDRADAADKPVPSMAKSYVDNAKQHSAK